MPRPTPPRAGIALLLALAAVVLAGCATLPPGPAPTFMVLRHAETFDDGTRDPALSPDGVARAARIADRLRHVPLEAVFASQFRRTALTAAPAAALHGLPVERYDARATPESIATALRARNSGGTMLVVGHSNTVPGLVAALCACEVAPIGEGDHDRWFELTPAADGTLVLHEARY